MHAPGGTPAPHRRVLMVADGLPTGGLERQLILLASHLPAEWEVRVASLGAGAYVDMLVETGVPLQVLERGYRMDVRPAAGLWRTIREWRPHVVHTWGWMSTAAAALPCRTYGIPLVDGSIRMGMVTARRSLIQRMLPRFADAAIANSRAGLDAFGVKGHRGHVVRNAFDPDRWALCLGDGAQPAFDAVMVGRMVKGKDFRCFLEAARLLRGQDPGTWRFAVLGAGADEHDLRQDFAELVEDGTVEFFGTLTEVLPHVRRAAVGVLLTDSRHHAEGISNAIMEYMACGLPVICSDGGGNRELVVDGETALVLETNSPQAVAEAIRLLRTDAELARSYGEMGRRRIQEEFTVDSLVNGTLEVYSQVAPPSRI